MQILIIFPQSTVQLYVLHNSKTVSIDIRFQSIEHYLFVCIFLSLFSLDHGGHFRNVPGLKKCKSSLTNTPIHIFNGAIDILTSLLVFRCH